jgi:hypothetical protein
MPLIDTAAGPVFVDDGATPEAIARIKAQMAKQAKSKPAPKATPVLTPEQSEVQRRVKAESKITDLGSGLQKKFVSGLTFNTLPAIMGAVGAGTQGVYKAIRHGDASDIAKEYRISRDTERALEKQSDGIGGTAAEIAGALANPVGTGATALKAMTFAPRIAAAGAKLEKAPALLQAVMAGSNQGALNSAGNALSSGDDLGHILTKGGQGYLAGGIAGGVTGAGVSGVRRAAQILRDRGPAAAERVAYGRIADMLAKGGKTPEQAARELHVTNARGGDGMVQDLTPGLRAQAGALSRRPDVPASNDMIQRGEQRLLDRPERFEAEIRKGITPTTGQDADAHLASVQGARKAHGQHNYDAVLDKNFVWNDDLEKFVHEAPPVTQNVLKDSVRLIENERKDPTALGIGFNAAGDVEFSKVPSMRVFDYMKRTFDQHIGQALRGGDNNTARILSNELDQLKQGIARSNPDYAGVLAGQRDFYQKAEATNLGLSVIQRLRKEPRAVLKELQALDPTKREDARTGIVDAIVGLRSQKADPVSFLQSVARTPQQRKVLEFAFDGKGNLARFERWMKRELRAKKADVLTAPGRQSETARFQAADDSLNEGAGGIAEHGLRGFAFGGPAGASAAIIRKFNDLRTGMSPPALEEMAHILMSNGARLPTSVAASRTYSAARKARNARAAVMAAKGAQQPVTDYSGD